MDMSAESSGFLWHSQNFPLEGQMHISECQKVSFVGRIEPSLYKLQLGLMDRNISKRFVDMLFVLEVKVSWYRDAKLNMYLAFGCLFQGGPGPARSGANIIFFHGALLKTCGEEASTWRQTPSDGATP
jgi:hypothetical protein